MRGFILEIGEIVETKPASWLQHFLGLHIHRAKREQYYYYIWEQRAFALNILETFDTPSHHP